MGLNIRGNNTIVFFIFGIAAGLACLSLSIFLKLYINGLFIPEIASQGLVSITSGEIESQAVLTLGPLAKYSTIIGAMVINVIIYGIIGAILGKLLIKTKQSKFAINFILTTVISYMISIVLTLIFIILSATPGQSINIPLRSILLFAIPSVTYGLLFAYLFTKKIKEIDIMDPQTAVDVKKISSSSSSKDETATTTATTGIDYNKRDMIRALIISVIALPLIYFGFNRLISGSESRQQQPRTLDKSIQQVLQSKSKPAGFENPLLTPLVDAEVTPTYLFYRIDINTVVPEVNSSDWHLDVKGLVNKPITINYEEIRGMSSVEQFATLTCISNKIGGNLVSTALWKGVKLRDILSKAGVKPNVKYIVFRCSDGYDVGIPIESGMMEGTVLAYDMNNSPLTSEHGFPVRAIVPGFYGMMNPKWITEIELVDTTYEGFWQRKGWSNDGISAIYSSIVIPGNQPIDQRFPHLVAGNNVATGKNVPVAGIAFAGDRGISKVEVSVDGGTTWKTAIVKDPLSKYTWVLWTSGFTVGDKNNSEIVVRATDKTGQVQTSKLEDPFPNGAEGYNRVNIST